MYRYVDIYVIQYTDSLIVVSTVGVLPSTTMFMQQRPNRGTAILSTWLSILGIFMTVPEWVRWRQ